MSRNITGEVTVQFYNEIVERGLDSLDRGDLSPVVNGALDYSDVDVDITLNDDGELVERTVTLRIREWSNDDPKWRKQGPFKFDILKHGQRG